MAGQQRVDHAAEIGGGFELEGGVPVHGRGAQGVKGVDGFIVGVVIEGAGVLEGGGRSEGDSGRCGRALAAEVRGAKGTDLAGGQAVKG